MITLKKGEKFFVPAWTDEFNNHWPDETWIFTRQSTYKNENADPCFNFEIEGKDATIGFYNPEAFERGLKDRSIIPLT